MTDNAFVYLSRAFAGVCELRGVRHVRIRPYTHRTNGKSERFIRTTLAEWAYARPYASSMEPGDRTALGRNTRPSPRGSTTR